LRKPLFFNSQTFANSSSVPVPPGSTT
jgi:hypothetical protein